MATLQTPFVKQAVAAITAAKALDVAGGCFSPDNIQTTGEVLDASASETQHQYRETRRSNDSISSESSDSTSIRSTTSEGATSVSSLESSDTITKANVKDITSSEKTTQNTSTATPDSSGEASSKGSSISNHDLKDDSHNQKVLELETLELETLELKTLELKTLELKTLELKTLQLKEQQLDGLVRIAVEADQARRESVQEAVGFIKKFVTENWETECENGQVKITCDVTMDKMMDIGRLEQKEGWRECLKLIKAPVIHDAIGMGLWQKLAKQVLEKDALEKAAREKGAAEKEMALIEKSPGDLSKVTDAHKRKRESSVQLEDDVRRPVMPRLAFAANQIESASGDISMSEQDSSNSDVPTSLVELNPVRCPTCACTPPASPVVGARGPKRDSISRRLSLRLTSSFADMAGGYGGRYTA